MSLLQRDGVEECVHVFMCVSNLAKQQQQQNKDLISVMCLWDGPGEQTMGWIAGTGTAVGGTGAKALGCQLRWRFLGGPLQVIAEDTKVKRKDKVQSQQQKQEESKNLQDMWLGCGCEEFTGADCQVAGAIPLNLRP